MKKLITLVLAVFTIAAYAQNERNDAELIRSAFQLEKKKIVSDYMALNNDDAAKFWPIYQKYETERVKLSDQRLKLIAQYIDGRQEKSVKDADAVMKESMSIQKQEIGLREKYYGEVKNAINVKTAFDFVQLEDMIATKIRMELWKALN